MYDDELMHYGILGMKWGVRRTPEELGHIRAEKGRKQLARYKSKQEAKVEKSYNKAAKKIQTDRDYDPDNATAYESKLANLKNIRDKSKAEIESMTYADMKAAKQAARDAGLKTARDVTITALRLTPVSFMAYGAMNASSVIEKFKEWRKTDFSEMESAEFKSYAKKGQSTLENLLNVKETSSTKGTSSIGDLLNVQETASRPYEERPRTSFESLIKVQPTAKRSSDTRTTLEDAGKTLSSRTTNTPTPSDFTKKLGVTIDSNYDGDLSALYAKLTAAFGDKWYLED